MKEVRLLNNTIEKVDLVSGKNIDRPFVLITVVGYDTRMLMSKGQFLRTLKNSFLLDENVESITSLEAREAMQQLMGGKISGKATLLKAGEKYTVTENSSVITNPDHPEYNEYNIGDEIEATRDSFRPEQGEFMSFRKSQEYINAEAYANKQLSALSAAMGIGGSSESITKSEKEVFENEGNDESDDEQAEKSESKPTAKRKSRSKAKTAK